MKNKILAITLILALSLALFVGCAKKSEVTTKDSTTNEVDQAIGDINSVNDNITDSQMDSDIADVEKTLNNW